MVVLNFDKRTVEYVSDKYWKSKTAIWSVTRSSSSPPGRGMISVVKAVRCSSAEWVRWGECAKLAGLSRNAWLRRAANEAAALEDALRRESEERP